MSAHFQSVARFARIIGLIVSLAVLGACSAIKIGYNNVPDLTYWWLDSYVDFREAQTLQVRNELTKLHQWHRANELPKMADLLQTIQRMLAADVTPEQVCSLVADVRARVEAVSAQAEPAVVALAASLRPEQIAQAENKLKKGNAEWREKWFAGTPAQRQARRLESMTERAEQLYDSLGPAQLNILQAAATVSNFDPDISLAERQRRQRDLLQTLRQVSTRDQPPPQAKLALQGYLERAVNSPDPAYRAQSEKALQAGCRTAALVHNSTTPEQRQRAVQRIAAYERDFRELSGQN